MNNRAENIRTLIRALRGGRRWLIASHMNPDGDAIGSLIGLGGLMASVGFEVTLYNNSGVPEIYSFLPGSEEVVTDIEGPLEYDGIIILDSGNWRRIGPLADRIEEFPLVVNIDHHVDDEPWGDVRWVDPWAPAVGEMIYSIAQLIPARITPEIARNLYTAVLTDTGSFRYGNTNARTLSVAADLAELGADPALCAREVYLTFSHSRLQLLTSVLSSLEIQLEGKLGLLSVDLETLESTGSGPTDLEGFVDYVRGLPGIEVAAIMRQEQGGYKFSLRSTGRVDVSQLAATFGGGGHRMAAGAFIDGTKDEARQALVDAAAQAIDG